MSETHAVQDDVVKPDDTEPERTAGLLRRLAALLYDAFLVFAIWMALGFALQFIVGPDTNRLVDGRVETDPVLSMILFIGMTLSAATFYIWFWLRTGQTLGMIAWRIKAVNRDGDLMSLKQGMLRFALAWPAFFCFGLGYLWLYVDHNGDALHDKLSGTRVVLLPKSARPF
ncbi:MAG: RDD family protein [Gammaproteobacteria bacterium]|nr:RDD family protein [Gammaproteobacteria bacterium]MDP2140662.1 RDD family protein [Gammaproteobacteria bacterium]MDP2347434.1 RDD family protein [Gammaproteobacteria bacterium]